MTSKTLEDFDFNGDPRDPEYWWEIISLKYQGYDPEDDAMVSVPVKHLEMLQQRYVGALDTLYEIAGTETPADIARAYLHDDEE